MNAAIKTKLLLATFLASICFAQGKEATDPDKKLTLEEAVEVMAHDIGWWETKGKGMPVGGQPFAIEITMQVRWKEEGKSVEYEFIINQDGEEISYFGHQEYDADKGIFIYRSKWGEEPETTSHGRYDPVTRTSHAETAPTTPPSPKRVSTITKRVGNDQTHQTLRVLQDDQLIYSHEIVSTRKRPVVSLFNGKDLTGWKNAKYVVEDGVLICKGGNLVTEKQYTNYVFEMDFLLPPGGNNGLGIHYPGTGGPSGSGMELQILDNKHNKYSKLVDSQYHGSLYKLKAAKRGHLKPAGEWNHQKVTVDGPSVKVVLNGVEILDANLDEINKQKPKHKGAQRRSGHICFCGHGAPVKFKNITIKELPAK